MIRSVLLSHPHSSANAKAAAAGLARAGVLGSYWTGIAAAQETRWASLLTYLGRKRRSGLNRLLADVPPERLRALWAVEVATRAAGALAPGRGSWRAYDALFVGHDMAVARLPWPAGTDAVFCYEDGALATFRRAARRDIQRLWELPAPHWRARARMLSAEGQKWPDAAGDTAEVQPIWKRERKDAEMRLASGVFVASSFTRSSVEDIDLGCPIEVVPYGFPVDSFRPRTGRPAGPFTVLAVGSQSLGKGTPYLLEAWRRAALPDARLRLVGSMKLGRAFLARYRGLFEHVPHMPRTDLQAEYERADLLAFPTLGDGFGMVIQEAMCCGVPVLTTRCGGGPECLEDGVEGWIGREGNVDDLVDHLKEAAAHRDRLYQMGQLAVRRANSYTWEHAGALLASKVRSWPAR